MIGCSQTPSGQQSVDQGLVNGNRKGHGIVDGSRVLPSPGTSPTDPDFEHIPVQLLNASTETSGGFAPDFGIETRPMFVGSAAGRMPPTVPISREGGVREKLERA